MIDEDDVFYECPFCGDYIENDGLWRCEGCDSILDCEGHEWECPYCYNEGGDEDDVERCPSCGSTNFHGACCYRCGYPSNMEWVGEQTDLQHHHR
ncbi:hypothetical protein [Methanobrevibacter sp.]|uniref:hypothetical protein n=1 Tax=Methanobrevibacter sp. TaxID=66852 RepID=UPI0025EECCD7|nr:hypothetical protein [Methanobrevibacter sp.]MBQ2831165.1 hypothetical protein [Methanobrevibacter sp.]